MDRLIPKSQDEQIVTAVVRIAWIFVAIGFLVGGYGIFETYKEGGFNLANIGALGSYLQGSVASIWSLAGLLFIYAAFLSQKKQLAQQEEELEAQKEQSEEQLHSIQLQNFENSLFQLINMLNQTVREMNTSVSKVNFENVAIQTRTLDYGGRDCFHAWYDKLKNSYSDNGLFERMTGQAPVDLTLKETAKAHFEKFHKTHQASLGHYFRVLYHIIKFIDESRAVPQLEKRRYTSLVRAQLSAYELVLFFYNGITPVAAKFRPLMETYGLLEHLDTTLLLHEKHEGFYDRAYK